MFRAEPVSRVLANSRAVKGQPPKEIVSSGVICLNPQSLQKENIQVLGLILVEYVDASGTKRGTIAQAWPLDTVQKEDAALDDFSLSCLGLDPKTLPVYVSRGTPTSNKRKAKKASKTKLRPTKNTNVSPIRRLDYNRKDPGNGVGSVEQCGRDFERICLSDSDVPFVTISSCTPAEEAHNVLLSSKKMLNLFNSDIFASTVSEKLAGNTILPGMIFSVHVMGSSEEFTVSSMYVRDSKYPSKAPLRCTKSTNYSVGCAAECEVSQEALKLQGYKTIGGLARQKAELKNLVKKAFRSDKDSHTLSTSVPESSLSSRHRPRGALLFGPSGTGKTLLACAIAAECSAQLEVVCGPAIFGNLSGRESQAINDAFAKAKSKQPCIVLLDEVDAIAPRRDAPNTEGLQKKLTAALLAALDNGQDTQASGIFVIGTTNQPDAVDPALRRAGRFDREIEVMTPSSSERSAILQVLTAKSTSNGTLTVSEEDLKNIALSCHGFVGSDLDAMWRESVSRASERGGKLQITCEDFRHARKTIQPSGLREFAIEIPTTKWEDIGGMDEAKRRLREAVEWPLTSKGADLFASIGVTPPTGILLYGPPGCSKTLLARAVATESGANFISVKGAELLSKWVGESEKAVQNIFRRARLAAPCVIFFDEIDALASARNLTAGASAQSRVVAQLLTDMDGIDSSATGERVVVIAATNRPDCLDAAFLRPGRIDIQIYVSLPTEFERLSILKVHTRRTPMDQDMDFEGIASDECTKGFSGAEIAALVREAALHAMQRDVEKASVVSKEDFQVALSEVKCRTPWSVIKFFERYTTELACKL